MNKIFKSKIFIFILAVAIITMTLGGFTYAQSSQSGALSETINVSGDLNVNYGEQEDASLGGLIQNTNPVFTEGLRAGDAMIQVINSNGEVLGNIDTATGTFSGAITVGGEAQMNRIVDGGDILSISTSSAETLTAAQVCDYSVISVLPVHAAVSLTLPASTTLAADCLDDLGDSLKFVYENAATAATNTTIVAGAGITLVSDDSNGDVVGQNGWAEVSITRIRESGDEFVAIIRPYTDAD